MGVNALMRDNKCQPQLISEYISRINRVLDYIESHLANSLTLDELANVAKFSKFHFHRIFSSFIGETVFEFIQRIRLERAADMLKTAPNKSITEICYDCGFINQSSFAKIFKKHFRVSASN